MRGAVEIFELARSQRPDERNEAEESEEESCRQEIGESFHHVLL